MRTVGTVPDGWRVDIVRDSRLEWLFCWASHS